jgi:hypothetical protein
VAVGFTTEPALHGLSSPKIGICINHFSSYRAQTEGVRIRVQQDLVMMKTALNGIILQFAFMYKEIFVLQINCSSWYIP